MQHCCTTSYNENVARITSSLTTVSTDQGQESETLIISEIANQSNQAINFWQSRDLIVCFISRR